MTAALRPLTLGTRASQLALTQSGQVGEQIVAGTGREVELVHVSTHGDQDRTSPLAQIGGTGVFVTAVRQALLDGRVDVVVHSCKDLPTQPLEEIRLASIPVREDPRDALCARDGLTLDQLPAGSTVGTGSPRRAAQLLRARPDLHVVGIRGNIETRLARALGEDADLDAVVLAAAGLQRVGRDEVISELLSVDVMLPAPAQGALAVEVTTAALEGATADSAPAWFAERLTAVDDPATRAAVTAERSLLRSLEAGCSAPVAAYAEIDGGELSMRALAIRTDGSHVVEGAARVAFDPADDQASGPDSLPFQLGAELAADLLERGAGQILAEAKA
ncbi:MULTISPECIES: hydroxymethylbilane synthase [Brachybacterium]|uniref:Porphobilinogen deaminase n=1 Tax=Brachybacterium alimentarium TaxID=47845 RepID=A0A2A3YGW4_9MICO|nr:MULTISPECIES: hydroxymethylbilane synthase [Brachybacterium]PCC33106.1 hydroxymethylbilane synthase [Brachybacterium alimentarium]PCC38596.1 hydroxymethylbilane synthase [Brachybacterium alimentarium]RCS57801.1 hydroxymethylbilane synthase [Brachybacterium sp. JB7]RCS64769.1 hydroxymethylbilane synthase [Brachybacterium alimentarium]RCS66650.1 hydroxymethylbilane synthase [Brachybacterium alimentarium]